MTKESITNWEKEVDNMFVVGNVRFEGLANNKLTPENLKQFISKTISQETKRLQEKIKELEKDKYGLQQWFDDLPEKRYDPEVKWRVSKQELEELLVNRISQEKEKWVEEMVEKFQIEGEWGKQTPFQQTVNTYIKNRGEEIRKDLLENN